MFQRQDSTEIVPFKKGERVKVSDCIMEIKRYQIGCGGFSENRMKAILGAEGRIVAIGKKVVTVEINQSQFDFSPKILSRQLERNSSLDIFRAVLEKNIDHLYCHLSTKNLNQQRDDGCTLINLACINGCEKIAKALLEFNPDLKIPNKSGQYPVHNCIQFHNETILRDLIEKDPFLLVQKNLDNKTTFDLAKELKKIELLDYLKNELDKQREDGLTLINLACVKGDLQITINLLEVDANLEISDNNGNFPIHNCVLNDNDQILGPLLRKDSLLISQQNGNNETVQMLLERMEKSNLLQSILNKGHKTLPIPDERPDELLTLSPSPPQNYANIQIECVICKDRPVNVVFSDCGHVCCKECSRRLLKCFMCQKDITKVIHLYLN